MRSPDASKILNTLQSHVESVVGDLSKVLGSQLLGIRKAVVQCFVELYVKLGKGLTVITIRFRRESNARSRADTFRHPIYRSIRWIVPKPRDIPALRTGSHWPTQQQATNGIIRFLYGESPHGHPTKMEDWSLRRSAWAMATTKAWQVCKRPSSDSHKTSPISHLIDIGCC
jgi:hypothetical protein